MMQVARLFEHLAYCSANCEGDARLAAAAVLGTNRKLRRPRLDRQAEILTPRISVSRVLSSRLVRPHKYRS